MATNRYFDTAGLDVTAGALAKAQHINNLLEETNSAFELVQNELDVISGGTTLSFAWANYDQGQLIDPINNPDDYSSKANSQEAQAWADGTPNVSTRADGVTTVPYSAKSKADEADASAVSAAASDASALAHKNKAEKWAEEVYNTEVETGKYSALHHATRAANAATNAEDSANSIGNAEANCLASEVAAAASEQVCEDWAEAAIGTGEPGTLSASAKAWAISAEDTAVIAGQFSAMHWAKKSQAEYLVVTAQGDTEVARVEAEGDTQYNRINGLDAVLKHEGDTGAADLPAGTTAQRPSFPNTGDLRFNTSTGDFEGYNGTAWVQPGTGSSVVGVPVGTIIPVISGYFGDGSNGSFTAITTNTIAGYNAAFNADGWYVCDGSALNLGGSPIFNGAGRYLPNLTDDRFIQGDTVAAGIGGENTNSHTHTGPSHTHSGGSHSHTVDIGSFSTGSTTISTSTMPSHRHSTSWGGTSGGWDLGSGSRDLCDDDLNNNTNYTGSSGSHNHSVNPPNTGTSSNSAGTTGASGATATSVPTDTENRPKFLSAIYLMRVI